MLTLTLNDWSITDELPAVITLADLHGAIHDMTCGDLIVFLRQHVAGREQPAEREC